MPNITEFDAGNLAIRPSETGVEAAAAAGRRIGAFYNQGAEGLRRAGQEIGRGVANAGDVAVNFRGHQQINAGADHASTGFMALQDDWNKTAASADVHDPTTAQKWREEKFEPWAQQFLQGFDTEKGQAWANNRVNEMRQHFYAETEGTMSHLAGVAAEETINKSINNYSNAVVANPGSLDTALKLYRGDIETTIGNFPNMKGEDAAKFREEVGDKGARAIVHSATMSAIMNARDPEAAAAAMAKKYPDYVSGAEELQFAKAAKVQSRANSAYAAQTKFYNEQAANAQVAQQSKQIWTNNVSKDAAGNVNINPQFFKDVMKMAATNSGASTVADVARTYLQWGERAQTGFATENNPQTDAALTDRMFAEQNPTSELDIRKAEAAGNLDPKYGDTLLDIIHARDAQPIRNPIFKQATDMAKGLIEGPSATTALAASGKYASFMQSFLPEYLKQLNAGTLKPNALDLSDDSSLISQALSPYRMGLGQIIRSNGGIGAPPQASM